MKIKQSVCLPMIKAELSNEVFLREIKAMGFAAIEIWQRGDDYAELCDLSQKYDLALCSMVGHQSIPEGFNNPANHSRIEDELKTSIDIAAKDGVAGLICFSGKTQAGMSPQESKANTAAGLARVAGYAEEKNVMLNLELLNSVEHPEYECDHTAWGCEVIKQVNSPQVKLLYDVYHMQLMEGNILNTIREYAQHFAHYHLAGVPGANDLDDEQEVNYTAVCRTIAATGYCGFIGHEFTPKGDPLAALKQAFITCEG